MGLVRVDQNGNVVVDNRVWDNRFQKGVNNVVILTKYRTTTAAALWYGEEAITTAAEKSIKGQALDEFEKKYIAYPKR